MASTDVQARLEAEQLKRAAADQGEMEIDLVELLYRLIEKAKYLILASVLGALLAGLYTSYLVTPVYTATSKLYVVNTTTAAIDLSALQVGTQLTSDYQEVFSNWHVHERVIQQLNLSYSYKQLSNMVSVSNPSSTRILYINVKSTSPEEAKLLADTYARVAQEFIAETMSTARPNIFQEALKPSEPSSPNKTRNIILGFMLGFLLAAGIITVQFLLDDRLHSDEDITKYIGLPVLGMMPDMGLTQSGKAKKKKAKKAGKKEARK